MDVDCSLEPVTEMNEAVEILSNTGQPLSSSIKDSDIPSKNVSEVVPSAEKLPVNTTTLCDLNSNFQQHAKTKGSLRQQLQMKRRQLMSSTASTVPSDDASASNSEKKKAVSPVRAASQVNC